MDNKDKAKNIWKKLIESDSKESSKRFLALYIVLVIGTIVTFYGMIRYDVDVVKLLVVWLSFAGSLLGISAWQSNRKDKYNSEKETEEIKCKNKSLRKEDEIN
jgi:hypothetical protein